MNDREKIFGAVRNALEPLKERASLPDYDAVITRIRQAKQFEDPWELFAHRLTAINGTPLKGFEALAAFLKDRGVKCGYCDPQWAQRIAPLCPGVEFKTTFDRSSYDDYEFGITKASGAVAATGTVVLKDTETSSRLGALSPWMHITLLHREVLWLDLATAIDDLGEDPAVIFVTGPSKTADVEGIMIEGVHGPGVQVCVLVD